jgi:hypothetical protein
MDPLLNYVVLLNKEQGTGDEKEEYNVFSVLGIQSREVLICRMIADLLNPRGRHGMGSAYLRLFVDEVLKIKIADETLLKHAVVSTEYSIDAERRIDIVLEIGKMFLPVEVKIYACEQKSQCYDYYTFAKEKDADTKVYYLTRFGHMPGAYSMRGKDGIISEDKIVCLSFQKDITHWLKECCRISTPNVGVVISQFEKSIEKVTDRLGEKRMEQIADEMVRSPETLRAGMMIADALEIAKCKVLYAVLAEFEMQMKQIESKYGLAREKNIRWYEYEDQATTAFYHSYSTYPGINYIVKNAEMNDGYQLWFRIEVEHHLFAGFCVFDPNETPEGGQQVDVYDEATKMSVARLLKVTQAEQENWWAVWRYLPTGTVKNTEEVPDFKQMNEAALALVDEEKRKAFVTESVSQMELSLLSLLK